ncbi:MAG: helix-turn-helix domain-containing protein [Bacillota bacterium]|nr:helix-turn-helix domain-containing protein [Bacillota bacterium]
MENLYSPEEISKILKIKEHTVTEYLRNGSLRGHKIGTSWKISESDLEEFLEMQENRTE